jgi:hypothetical protein
MTQIQQFHRFVALFVMSVAWVLFVATVYCANC